jgi:hypothetical protein
MAKRSVNVSFFLYLLTLLFMVPLSADADNSNSNNANERRLIRQVENVEKVYHRHVARLQEADSLINTGDTIRERTSTEIRQANLNMLACAKSYNTRRKDLDKKLQEVNRSEANAIRLEIRELEAQYRDELKQYDDFMRLVIRESELGTSSYVLGKRYRKEAMKGIRISSKRLEELRKGINDDTQNKEYAVER